MLKIFILNEVLYFTWDRFFTLQDMDAVTFFFFQFVDALTEGRFWNQLQKQEMLHFDLELSTIPMSKEKKKGMLKMTDEFFISTLISLLSKNLIFTLTLQMNYLKLLFFFSNLTFPKNSQKSEFFLSSAPEQKWIEKVEGYRCFPSKHCLDTDRTQITEICSAVFVQHLWYGWD